MQLCFLLEPVHCHSQRESETVGMQMQVNIMHQAHSAQATRLGLDKALLVPPLHWTPGLLAGPQPGSKAGPAAIPASVRRLKDCLVGGGQWAGFGVPAPKRHPIPPAYSPTPLFLLGRVFERGLFLEGCSGVPAKSPEGRQNLFGVSCPKL